MKRANISYVKDRLPSELFGHIRYVQVVRENQPPARQNVLLPLLAWCVQERWDIEAFTAWAERSFACSGEHETVRLTQLPPIYYDLSGMRTQYSLVFDEHLHQVLIWHWDVRIFRGSLRTCQHYLRSWLGKEEHRYVVRQ